MDGGSGKVAGPESRPESRDDSPLYADRVKVYPRRVKGTVRRIKWAVLILCLAVYYLAPWLRWDRGPGRPDQALLIDMAGRRGYFFGIEIWPQEVYYLAGLLILGAIGLFLVTSLFGRMWCGFTCPQTVWTDLFMWTERLIEGDRMARMHLDREPLSLAKLRKKLLKHGVWLVIAAATGGAWIMYFNDAPTMWHRLLRFEASSTVYFFFGLFTATTYLLAGWAREQVCTYMCPWPRFQSAMVDDETLTVTYRDWRGEPRGKHKKGDSWEGHGDCVDCHACIAVCPTGVDIRDGLQLECIGCGLCIDACNEIMDNVERPRGLIAFDNYTNRLAQQRGEAPRFRLLRPRTLVYVAVLMIASAAMITTLATRHTVELTVLPDRMPLYVTLSDGSVRNSYTLKIVNKNPAGRRFILTGTGLPGASLSVAGAEDVVTPLERGTEVAVKGDSVGSIRLFLRLPHGAVAAETPFEFSLRAVPDGETVRYATSFRAPG